MSEINELLLDFIKESRDKFAYNQWLFTPEMKVYVRKAHHLIKGDVLCCLDIATIEIIPEKRRQGLSKDLLRFALENNEYDALYIENVQEKEIAQYFFKNNWGVCGVDYCPCFYKLNQRKKDEYK
jgi:hypothetical protein